MVDPNRKINRLTDEDLEFLEECEREFSTRYSEDDAEFMEHCAAGLADPPIIENWGSNESNDSGHHHSRGGGSRYQRNWRGSGGYNRNFGSRRGFRGGVGGSGRYQEQFNRREHERHDERDRERDYNRTRERDHSHHNDNMDRDAHHRSSPSQSSSRPPIPIRRDYNNFVAASKD